MKRLGNRGAPRNGGKRGKDEALERYYFQLQSHPKTIKFFRTIAELEKLEAERDRKEQEKALAARQESLAAQQTVLKYIGVYFWLLVLLPLIYYCIGSNSLLVVVFIPCIVIIANYVLSCFPTSMEYFTSGKG